MKKILLLSVILAAAATDGMAKDQVYTYTASDNYPVQGAARRVSANGQWVVGADDIDQTGGYIINTLDPEVCIEITDGQPLDVDNNGTVVGSWYNVVGYSKSNEAAYYRDGEWVLLPLPEEIIGQSYAVGISSDGKVIGGMGYCTSADPSEPGCSFPMTWRLNESTGKYEIEKLYNDLWLPGTYGFWVTGMSSDARYICGYQGLNMGDNIEVLLDTQTGELLRFHTIEHNEHVTIVTHPSTGLPYEMTSVEMEVDGLVDGFDQTTRFGGMFMSVDNGYAYGCRDIVSDVKEDGSGKITTYATVYDIANDKFYDGNQDDFYLTGEARNLLFNARGEYVYGGVTYDVNEDFPTGSTIVAGIYDMDSQARVLTGSYLFYTPLGDIIESPVVLILDKGLSAIKTVGLDPEFTATVTVEGNTINVTGADDVAIFDLNGRVLTRGNTATVTPGVYLVIADGVSAKVIVR